MDIQEESENQNGVNVKDIVPSLNGDPEVPEAKPVSRPKDKRDISASHDEEKSVEKPRPISQKEQRLRRFLRLHRYSPVKWKNKKLHFNLIHCIVILFQIVKIILITIQVIKFAGDRAVFSDVVNRGHITLRHLLLKGWDSGQETPPYPPAHGDFAVYEIEELIEHINYAVERYFNAENDAIGFYKLLRSNGYNDDMTVHMRYFNFPGFDGSETGLEIEETSFPVDIGLNSTTDPITNKTRYMYNIRKSFEILNLTDPVKRLLSIRLGFRLHSVRVYEISKRALCLFIQGTISFLDEDNNGQMLVDLDTRSSRIKCSDINYSVPDVDLSTGYKALGIAVLIFCGVSGLCGVLSFTTGLLLIKATKGYMRSHFQDFYEIPKEGDNPTDLDLSEYFKLGIVLIWDVMIIGSDALTITGVTKIAFDPWTSHEILSDFDGNAVCLSLGGQLALLYTLKIFKLESKFHILFKTLAGALKAMLAYLICIGVLFVGFFLIGYVVLGPYHVKFETASSTIETLFSISNGDEIYATLANVEYLKTGSSSLVWWFSRVYICTYVAVFTIVVLNILIAIFVEAYDEIKEEQRMKKEKRKFGPLEKALFDFLTKQNTDRSSNLRSSLFAVLQDQSYSTEESKVQAEIRKVWKMTDKDNCIKLERLRERTVTAFMEAEDDCLRTWNTKYIVIYLW